MPLRATFLRGRSSGGGGGVHREAEPEERGGSLLIC